MIHRAMHLARSLRVQVVKGRSNSRALSFWSSGESKSNDPVGAKLPGISKKDEDYYDLWMRGDPYRLWSESLGHRMATGLPSWSDVWGIVTKQQAIDPDLMPKMAAYLDVYGYKLHGRAVEQVDPHQTLDEVLGGAQHVAAAVTDAIATLQRHDAAVLQAANQNVTNDPASDVGDEASAEASTFPPLSTSTTTAAAAVMKMPSATEVAQARELLAATMGPRLREAFFRSDSSSSFSSSAAVANESEADKKEEKEATSSLLLTPQAAACMPLCPQGLAPEAFGVSVTSVRVVVASRTPLKSLDELVPAATSSNAAFAPQLTDAFHLGLFPDRPEEDGGNALVCLREVESGLYSSSFPVTPAFLAALRSEIDENGVDGEGSSVDAGSIGFSFGGKGGFTPMGGNSSNSSTLATGKGSNGSGNSSGGGMAGEVSGTELAAFLTARGLTFPVPKDREAFASLLVDVHLYAHHRIEPPPTTTTVADQAETGTSTASSATDGASTSSQSVSSPLFPPASSTADSPSEPISDAEWARVEALIKNPEFDVKAEKTTKPVTPAQEEQPPPQMSHREEKKQTSMSSDSSTDGNQTTSFSDLFAFFNDGGEKSSEGSGGGATSTTTKKGPRSPASSNAASESGSEEERGDLWQSTWTLGMRVDPRPGRRWDYEWHVADLDGAPLGLATRSIGAAQTSEALGAASDSTPDETSTEDLAAAAAVAAAQEAERAWAALSAAPYLMDDEEEKPEAFFPNAKKKEAQQPAGSTEASTTIDASNGEVAGEVDKMGKEAAEENETAVESKDLPLGKTGRSKEI